MSLWYNFFMPSFVVETKQRSYPVVVEGTSISKLAEYIPETAGKIFVVTTEDVWQLHGEKIGAALKDRQYQILFFPGGEDRKRLAEVEKLAEEMVSKGGDRASIVVTFGGGIVDDVGGFLAATFMRGVPVIQIPTTLLAQVDAGVGGKTGVNLVSGKNLVGAFHQPLAVLIDPDLLATLPEREYRAGLYELLKTGVIRSAKLFETMTRDHEKILRQDHEVVVDVIAQSVKIKAEVVSADEREGDLRRILNFGHTIGHALEGETAYSRFLHGEAVAFGMRAAVHLARLTGHLNAGDAREIMNAIRLYGPIPSVEGISADNLFHWLASDKKTLKGTVHFVLPVRIGRG